MVAGQSQRFYSVVGIFNWCYLSLSSPPQIPRVPGVELETGGLVLIYPFLLRGCPSYLHYRRFWALNGHDFRSNAHLTETPTSYRRLKESKPEGDVNTVEHGFSGLLAA